MFLRVPLPYGGERDGEWSVEVFRGGGGGEFPPPAVDTRYFVNIVANGGPRLERMPMASTYYTGDAINPLVALKYPDGTFPPNARVRVTVTRPSAGVGNILTGARLRPPATVDSDTIPARQATLQALESESGQPAVGYAEETFELFDDAAHEDGTFEPDGIFGNPREGLLRVEGNYTFHFRATYGESCTATRELIWSLHVDVGIDPSRSDVTIVPGAAGPGGSRAITVTIVPRDSYGSHLGPGRPDAFSVSGVAGTTVTGAVQDNGDGSYTATGEWDPSSGHRPGVVIGQPDRPCVVAQEPARGPDDGAKWKLLIWLLVLLALLFCRRRKRMF
jgi:hypothetical protein